MRGDFIGFSFDGVHSEELNIVRVSDGDRYSEDLFPEFDDKTLEDIDRDGFYYFGTKFKSRTFEVKFAFDNVSEVQYRWMRRLFSQKKICELIFDERPYKIYMAKVESPVTLETLCFDEPEYTYEEHDEDAGYVKDSTSHKVFKENNKRVYKGEGTVTFITYFPFARQMYKTLDEYVEAGWGNTNEWADSSMILSAQNYSGKDTCYEIDSDSDGGLYNKRIDVYNAGDIDTPYYLYLPYVDNTAKGAKTTKVYDSDSSGDNNYIRISNISTGLNEELVIKPITNEGGDDETGIVINTRAGLIEGVHFDTVNNSWQTTGTVYNKNIVKGRFQHIMKGNSFDARDATIQIQYDCNEASDIKIFYNYLYF